MKTKHYRYFRNILTGKVNLYPMSKMYHLYKTVFIHKGNKAHHTLLSGGGKTVVTLPDGVKGVAVCDLEDAFVKKTGRELALKRALEKQSRFWVESTSNLYVAVLRTHADGTNTVFVFYPTDTGAISGRMRMLLNWESLKKVSHEDFLVAYGEIINPYAKEIADAMFKL